MTSQLTVTHLFDAAEVGKVLVRAGRAQGFRWKYRPARNTSRDANPFFKYPSAARWHAGRIIDELPSDFIHLHYGRRTKYLRLWPRRPYVLHFHGTDIRHHFLQPYAHDEMLRSSAGALAVLYSTPDLRENSLLARADAQYFPTPIDRSTLPSWMPAETPTVVFTSRWDGSKNAEEQIKLATLVARAVPRGVRVQGLDWGEAAADARRAGIELVPRMPRPAYLRWLAGAHVAVGQSAGVLAISELEAIGIGVPVVMPLHESYSERTPVYSAATNDELVEAMLTALEEPERSARSLSGPEWLRENHDATTLARRLNDLYVALPR